MSKFQRGIFSLLANKKTGSPLQKIIILTLLIIIGIFAPEMLSNQAETIIVNEKDTISTSQVNDFNGYNFEIFPKMTKIPVNFVSANDGDTITVRLNNHKVKVRYLMINTPEMNYENGQANPDFMAQEAYDRNVALLSQAKQVSLVLDVGPATDNYNRALAYIYADDILVSEELIKEGLGTVRYVNPPNNSFEQVLREAESTAKSNKVGLWH